MNDELPDSLSEVEKHEERKKSGFIMDASLWVV